jgi:hypothetical protein
LFLKAALSRNLNYVSEDFNIEWLHGHAEITKRLQFPYSDKFTYKIIGIYDGDMKNRLSDKTKRQLNWGYCFLPSSSAIEIEFRNCIRENHLKFSESIRLSPERIIHALSRIEGEDHHDWLMNFSKFLGKDIMVMVDIIFDLWEEKPENKIGLELFISDLKRLSD